MIEKLRDSNFELLRLICMFYIILHHFIVHGLKTAGYFGDNIDVSSLFFNSFFVIAVNCFVLISGYFGIKFSWKSFVHLYITCVFYILGFTVLAFIYKDSFSIKELLISFLPFSHSPYWFINSYIYLFLLSPILNKAINNFTKREFILALFILALLSFYFGFFWQGSINSNGCNFMNFIFLYFIARFIALHTKNVRSQKRIFFFSYIINSLIIASVGILIYYLPIDNAWIPKWGYTYNNPFVIFSAVSFFLLFRTFNIKSTFINQIAKSSLAIYLIHENPNIRGTIYNFVHMIAEYFANDFILILIFPLLALLMMTMCILLDKVRLYVVNIVENFIYKIKWNKYYDKLVKYIE